MRDLFDKEFQKEMDDFFDYIDYEVLGRTKPEEPVVEEITDEDWDWIMAGNLRSTQVGCQLFAAQMKNQEHEQCCSVLLV